MLIKGLTYIEGKLVQRYIRIEEGIISAVSRSPPGDEDIFHWDGVILPAGIDLHVHFRDPGSTHKEDFFSGSKSAAFGGITTVMDMPNTKPQTDDISKIKSKIDIASKKSCIDFGLYGMAGEDAVDMCELTEHFKVFMGPSTDVAGGFDKKSVTELLERGCKLAFHCEDEDLFGEPGEDLEGHNKHRPPESEVSAIGSLEGLPEGHKRICHISTKEGMKTASKASYILEVTPHHLLLSEEAFLGPFGKVNPPLRDVSDQHHIWDRFARGKVDVLASDHAPHLYEEKDVEFHGAPSGIPGVETMYPLMLNLVSIGKISLSTIVRSIAERPGELLGISKGRIAEGYHGDMVLVDFRESENIDMEKLHSKAGWSPFDRFRAIFPRHVICRGEFVIKDREFVGESGRGLYIKDFTEKFK